MNRQKPVSGEFYRHFKGGLYQIKMLAKDCETQREMVVYQAMYEPFECWVRDLEEFMEVVDGRKYPEASQKYRFEPTDPKEHRNRGRETADMAEKKEEVSNQLPEEKVLSGAEIANRGLLQLLDAETFKEKKQIFIGLKQYMDKRMLTNIAVALDIVLEEGSMEEQFDSILHCLEAFEHYEGGGRLR